MTATAAPPATLRRLVPVAGAVLLAGAVRLWYLLSPVVQFNADEATTGIMVREILAGRHYVFYAGQDYGGTLEQYLEAGTYALFRLPQNAVTLRLPLVLLCMGTCALVHAVAGRLFADPVRPVVAALLYAVSPWFNVIGSVTSLGFYAAGQFLTIAVVYTALRDGRGWLLGTGLLAGLGVWTSPTALYVLVPVLFRLLPALRADPRRWAVLAGGGVLGAAPLLGWLAANRRLPIPPGPAEQSSVLQRLGNLAEPVLRQYAGVAYSQGEGGLRLPLQVAVVAALVAGYGWALLRHRRGPAALLLAVPPVVAVLYALSTSTWYTGTPRYLLVTYPLLAVGVAGALRRLPAAVPVLALSALLSVGFFRGLEGGPTTAERDALLARVTDTLVAEGRTHVAANYWTAMPLQYVAGDRLVVSTAGGAGRFPESEAAVEAAPDRVLVGNMLDRTDAVIRRALDERGLPYRTRTFGYLVVFDRLPAGADTGL